MLETYIMNNKIKIAIKFALFVLITMFCVNTVNEWLKPGTFYNEKWPSTNTYEDFYALKRDSVDVLILGSSHAVSAINPQIIYDNYGITSYNLGSEQQSLVVSYFWLREALKTQSPKTVILDTYMLHKFSDGYVYNNMNCGEGAVRKAMDYMRLSPLKWEAAKTIEKIDPSQSALSFILTNIRYHTRWMELSENDFTKGNMISHGGIKGYTVMEGSNENLSYVPFSDANADESDVENMVETSREYLDKIAALCAMENIQLILVNIPCNESVRRYVSTKEYANENNIPYYDFNEEKLYEEIAYNASEDLLSHPNYKGAEKISDYIGSLLSTVYDVTAREDSSYEDSRLLYNHKVENAKLKEIRDINQYIDKINNDNYSVFIFGAIDFSECVDDETIQGLKRLGFSLESQDVKSGTHYCAVKDRGKITEKITDDDIQLTGAIRDGLTTYSYMIDTTNMLPMCHIFSLKIDGQEYGSSDKGLKFVIYDNEMKSVVDTVNFDKNE